MSIWKVSIYIFVFLFVTVFINPSFVFPKEEDTVHLSFRRTVISKDKADVYSVKKNEWLSQIIRKRFNVSDREIYNILKLVKQLNPDIKDLNRIRPGQKLLLPQKKASKEDAARNHAAQALVMGEKKAIESNVAIQKEGGVHSLPSQAIIPGQKKGNVSTKYVVKSGDTISEIIHDQLGVSHSKIYQLLAIVEKLNPAIKDLNRIYPGQTLILPGKIQKDVQQKGRIDEEKFFIPRKKYIAVLKYIVERMYGSVIADGIYCIPMPPSGQITIDCSRVPVVKMNDGSTMLLDLSNRMPERLKRAVESTWNNYSVINIGKKEEIASVLEKLISASNSYDLNKLHDYKKIGKNITASVYSDWIISKRTQTGIECDVYVVNFLKKSCQLIPLSIKEYADKNGVDIIELVSGVGVKKDGTKHHVSPLKVLNSDTKKSMVDSFLSVLGYVPLKDSEVKIFDMDRDGFNVSIRADFVLNTEGKRTIISFNGLSQQFLNVLKGRGDEVIFISEKETNKNILGKILRIANIPYVFNTFRYTYSGWEGREGGKLDFSALRVKKGNQFIYFIDYEIDREIYGLLNKRWGVNLIKY